MARVLAVELNLDETRINDQDPNSALRSPVCRDWLIGVLPKIVAMGYGELVVVLQYRQITPEFAPAYLAPLMKACGLAGIRLTPGFRISDCLHQASHGWPPAPDWLAQSGAGEAIAATNAVLLKACAARAVYHDWELMLPKQGEPTPVEWNAAVDDVRVLVDAVYCSGPSAYVYGLWADPCSSSACLARLLLQHPTPDVTRRVTLFTASPWRVGEDGWPDVANLHLAMGYRAAPGLITSRAIVQHGFTQTDRMAWATRDHWLYVGNTDQFASWLEGK